MKRAREVPPFCTAAVLDADAGPVAGGQADLDARDRAGDKASRADRQDQCTLGGPLDVAPGKGDAFVCPAARSAGTQVIRAKVTLAAHSACAVIRAHDTGSDAYRTTVCAGRIAVDIDQRGRTRTVAMSAIDPPAQPGAWHQIEIHTPGNGVTVTFDGDEVINRTRLPALGRGAVSLGSGPGPGQVSFAEVEISSVG
jgi:hypothetical protein